MNYQTWNQLLLDYFFAQRETQVFLSIEKEDLLDLALASSVFQDQIKGQGKANYSIKEKRDYAWKDFLHLFFAKGNNYKSSLNLFLGGLARQIKISSHNVIPTVFPYIVLFVLPLSNEPDLQARAFYPKVNNFLRKNFLINSSEAIGTNNMSLIDPSLNSMWINLSEWAKSNGYIFSVNIPTQRADYTGPFLSQLIFTASQRDKFKLAFYKSGLTPSQDVTDATALSVISDNLRIIGVSQNRWDVIRQHYPESAISIFNKEYEQWDGMALIRHRDNSQTDQQYLGVNQKLLLSISAYHGKIMYGLYAQLPDAEPGEDFTYNSSEFGEFSFSISRDCLSFDCKWNDSIKSAVLKNNPVVFLKEGDNTVKLTYKPSNIEILESHYDKFISSRKFQAGRKYRVLIKNSEIDKYSTWLVENNAQLIQNHDLNDAYSLYSIDCAKTDLQTSELKKLHFDEKIDAKVVDTIILRRADNGAIVLYRDLPAYFQVSGIDVSKNKVRAVFNSDGGMEEVHLQYDEGANVWKLPVITNKFTLQKTFQLYCDTKLISSTSYKVDDFNIMPTAEYDEICYNEYGEVDYNGKFKGLQLPPSHNVNWENLESSMSREGRPPKPQNSEYRFTDFLLYYISTRPRLERKEFEDIINMLIHNDIFEFKIENKWSRRTLLDNYFRLGYCNYAYMDGKHIISVNKPTMVLLPPKVKRTKFGNIVRLEHTENFWTVFLSGARTPDTIKALQNSLSSFKYEGNKIMMEVKPSSDGLLPQSVYLRSESLEAIEKFAKMNGYEFQKNIYSNCLLQDLASVDDYLRHIMSVESPEVYDGIMNCETIDYKELAATGQFRKVKNFETNKAVVTYFPNTFREVSIIWSDGKQYQSDKHWGHFVGMHFADAQVLIYDKEDSKFKLPIFIQLPKLYARALSLISGEIPHEEGRIRTYELYENPYVHSVDSDSIIKKLS